MNKLVLSIAAPLSLAGPLLAQGPGNPAPAVPYSVNQGAFNGWPLGVHSYVEAPASVWEHYYQVGIRPRGASGPLPPFPDVTTWNAAAFGAAASGHPDYSPEALYKNWLPSLFDVGVAPGSWGPAIELYIPELNGMSTGSDITPPVATLTMQQNNPQMYTEGQLLMDSAESITWYVLSMSMEDGTTGAQGGIIDEVATTATAGTQQVENFVFSYTAEGSTGIRPGFEDTARIEYTADQLGLDSTRRLSALDWGMGLISDSNNGPPTSIVPERNTLYFTLSRRWLTDHAIDPANTGQYLPMPGTSVPMDPATIYVMTWDGTNWSVPEVAITPMQLLGDVVPNADVDGLSVYQDGAYIARVVFSLDQVGGLLIDGERPNQILVTQFQGGAVTAAPLRTASGMTFTEKLGVDDDEEDSPDLRNTCGTDPGKEWEVIRDQRGGTPCEDVVDLPENVSTGIPTNMGHSSWIHGDIYGASGLHLQVSGLDFTGSDLIAIRYVAELYNPRSEEVIRLMDETVGVAIPGLQTTSDFNVPLIPALWLLSPWPKCELQTYAIAYPCSWSGEVQYHNPYGMSWPCRIQLNDD